MVKKNIKIHDRRSMILNLSERKGCRARQDPQIVPPSPNNSCLNRPKSVSHYCPKSEIASEIAAVIAAVIAAEISAEITAEIVA
jgi:hypothetical protein